MNTRVKQLKGGTTRGTWRAPLSSIVYFQASSLSQFQFPFFLCSPSSLFIFHFVNVPSNVDVKLWGGPLVGKNQFR